MNPADIVFFPFMIALGGAMIIIGLILLAFWIWMIVDCAKRKFTNDTEKIVWIIAIALMQWFGALVYFIVIRMYNPTGIYKDNSKNSKVENKKRKR